MFRKAITTLVPAAILSMTGSAAAMRWIEVDPESPVTVSSSVPELHIRTLQILPKAPHDAAGLGDFCRNKGITPTTPGGKAAAARGWTVTSEEALGPYTAVGIFSRGGNATSGICLIQNGNIAVWQGSQLLAGVYDAQVEQDAGGRVGGVTPLEGAPAVRIWDWIGAGPTADLVLADGELQLRPTAPSDSVCKGRNTVANVYGKPVPQARRLLARNGWKPLPPSAADADNPHDPATRYRKQGMPEFESCSGTGMGYCGLNYRHANGARLMVTTIGDDHRVANWSVQCP